MPKKLHIDFFFLKKAEWVVPNNRPSKAWPENGEIIFKNYSVRYRPELDPVLKSIDSTIKPGEKVRNSSFFHSKKIFFS
jgi:ABC-type multidrug transport system fused ATPase/permease subunit